MENQRTVGDYEELDERGWFIEVKCVEKTRLRWIRLAKRTPLSSQPCTGYDGKLETAYNFEINALHL